MAVKVKDASWKAPGYAREVVRRLNRLFKTADFTLVELAAAPPPQGPTPPS